ADTAEDHFAQLHQHQRHGATQRGERVVHAVDRAAGRGGRDGGGYRDKGSSYGSSRDGGGYGGGYRDNKSDDYGTNDRYKDDNDRY
ncbi:MAG TPA: hypothetical protein PLC89_23255, partial [Haliscomenobacter sp.]|nr:hypothetical protein [Haliscomenobacter sp.]